MHREEDEYICLPLVVLCWARQYTALNSYFLYLGLIVFGFGFSEILVILVIVLLVLGPDKVPEFTRTLGKTIWKIRHAADELKSELRLEAIDIENEIKKDD